DRLDELEDPGVRVDQPELGRRHAEGDRSGGYTQIAGQGELEPAADRVAVQCGQGGERIRLDRLQRGRERVGDQPLGFGLEATVTQVPDVVAGRERLRLTGDDHAPGVQAGQG